MKNLSIDDINSFDLKGVNEKIDELKREYFNLKMSKSVSRLEKPHLIKVLRRNIARLLTVKTMMNRENQ